MHCTGFEFGERVFSAMADPGRFDEDPDPTFQVDADPDLDPDPKFF